MEQVLKKEKQIQAKPIMKWAGGKTQMLGDIMPKIPQKYGKYIEPFIGGGALFFALSPDKAIIADSNPELINMYRQVADNVESVISYLKKYKNTKEDFYEVRSLDWLKLKKEEAAARTIYLNKTCFNGLYRVNKKGQFNVPFGKYKAPNFCDEEALYAASDVLKKATITCGDYLSVLKEYAEPGDFIFLDPPYLPISEYSDFKRYTKEQFYEEDHVELAKEVKRLQELGCHVILTNSNHPLVHELYADYKIEVIQTKRYISCKGAELPTDNVDTAKALLDDLIKQMKSRQILFDINDLPLKTATEINIARRRLENILSQTDEIQYAKEQCNQWQEIADYMELLIKGGGKRTYDDDNVIEVPKDETPAYLEWILWRASLAIDHMVNKPYEVRGFKLDSDFLPVSAAGGGKGDLYCEFNDFTILTEVTMSTSSRQERNY